MTSLKQLFLGYLSQLRVIVEKIPEDVFSESLHEDMLTLEINVQIAANFLMRAYCPLLGEKADLCELSANGKRGCIQLINEVQSRLEANPDIQGFDDTKILSDKAGFAEVRLPQSLYVFRYIVPNYMFHMSMVYAIARKAGVSLSKGDFDGLHAYPHDFSFD